MALAMSLLLPYDFALHHQFKAMALIMSLKLLLLKLSEAAVRTA